MTALKVRGKNIKSLAVYLRINKHLWKGGRDSPNAYVAAADTSQWLKREHCNENGQQSDDLWLTVHSA